MSPADEGESGWKRARPEVLAFLQDIKEHPEDDTPRLILADWLQDYGDVHDAVR